MGQNAIGYCSDAQPMFVQHLTLRKETLIFRLERMVRGGTKDPLVLRGGDDLRMRSTQEIVVSTFGARSPSTVDRSGIIPCFLKFLLNRTDLRGAKLTRVNDWWDHISPARTAPNRALRD